jgi:hypothetical protein
VTWHGGDLNSRSSGGSDGLALNTKMLWLGLEKR